MTNPAESEELTRVGPGTPMGQLMRQYWIPAAASSDVIRAGDPLQLMLLGEKLIAFRDQAGRLGGHGPPLPTPLCLPVLWPE